MRRLLAAVVMCGGWVVPAIAAQPTVHARVVATQPSTEALLGRDETFYVRIEYTSDEPVKLWARPYFHGKEAPAMSNPSRDYVVSGDALGWFAFREPAEVDELRITAGGGKPYREWKVASYPVRLKWTTAASESHDDEPWVTELRAADRAAEQAAMRQRMNEPLSAGDEALFWGFMLLVLVAMISGIIAPVWAIRKWRGGWRIAAAIPLVPICFVVVRLVIDTAIDPTSHNLWPFELGMFALAGLAIIGGLALIRRVTGVDRS